MKLLLENGAPINVTNKNGSSPLHVAVNKFHLECVRVLLAFNCDLNAQDSYGDTPLHDIMGKSRSKQTSESEKIVDLLLGSEPSRINIFLKNKMDFNVFQYACLKGNSV